MLSSQRISLLKNRLKDIHNMVSEISEKFSVNVSFKYVPSENNPADMITKDLSIDKFKQQLDVWVSGPEWLRSTPVDWPKSDLNCLSDNSKNIVQATVMYNTLSSLDVNAVVPENKYSRLDKLIAVTSRVFQLISKLRKKDEDYSLKAKQYLFKIMQEKCYPNELVSLRILKTKMFLLWSTI